MSRQQYRKKPVVVEAIQYGAATCVEICAWIGVEHRAYEGEPCGVGVLIIPTLEGDMIAQPGDYIIRGIKGEFYPCKPDIFADTYEPAPNPASPEREG